MVRERERERELAAEGEKRFVMDFYGLCVYVCVVCGLFGGEEGSKGVR